ncbi:hypothetical protein BD626DRAFT_504661 [Schizophyllum amplum]|uniref:MYND-type domain-containing protein n=1 Tax=Schizophyllum amplum TaxID=97359 RepID=A0A550C734_9AGAR|nr:hypothetical protein BD626DRAFT_504661 [Auriculariopsis ampla]
MAEGGRMQRIPPHTAYVGQACFKCHKSVEESASLKTCTSCRRVRYCSVQCQKDDWKAHKAFCKALRLVESDPATYDTLSRFVLNYAEHHPYHADRVNKLGEGMGVNEANLLIRRLGRPMTTVERNVVGWQARCMTCARTDSLIRMEAARNNSDITPLSSCSDCHLSFYCKPEHWQDAQRIHADEPSEDGHHTLTQCAIQRQMRLDQLFRRSIEEIPEGPSTFQWAPDRQKDQWTSLADANWESEFGVVLSESLQLDTPEAVASSRSLGPMLHCASDGLSMPMTILYGLENLNSDDTWTTKATLTIHVLGPAVEPELMKAQLFEEIMHQLPKVQTLQIIFCGPDIPPNSENWMEMETCPRCRRAGRKRRQRLYSRTYHEYALRLGSAYEVPDLAVAFNSGCSQEARDSWVGTIKHLVQRKVPTIFTAFNREEGEAEGKLFANAGATLVPALGPRKNP